MGRGREAEERDERKMNQNKTWLQFCLINLSLATGQDQKTYSCAGFIYYNKNYITQQKHLEGPWFCLKEVFSPEDSLVFFFFFKRFD